MVELSSERERMHFTFTRNVNMVIASFVGKRIQEISARNLPFARILKHAKSWYKERNKFLTSAQNPFDIKLRF